MLPRILVVLLCLQASSAPADSLAARLKKDVFYLASDKLKGRGAGTPELDKAAGYIAHRFWQLGLQGGTASGWYQTVPVSMMRTGEISAKIEAGGNTFVLSSSNAHAMAAAPVDVSGARAVKLDRNSVRDLPRDGLDGKVVLTSDLSVAMRAARREPALVILGGAADAGLLDLMPDAMPVLRTVDPAQKATILVTKNAEISKWIEDLPGGAVEATVTAKADGRRSEFNLRNVLGLLPGSDPVLKNTYIIVSAHYDHLGETRSGTDRIRNGANDDASGVAAMLGVARNLMRAKTRPKRSVLFVAWTGEEAGGLGSSYYATYPVYPLRQTVANINIEQVGRHDGEGGAGPKRVLITGYSYSDIGPIATQAAKAVGVEAYAGPDPFFGRSDNIFLAQAGVPAHTFAASLEFPDYHKASDSAEKLDYANMALLTNALSATVRAIADSAQAPRWSDTEKGAEPYRNARPR